MMLQKEFTKKNIHQKIQLLKAEGEHVGAREFPAHFIHLFVFSGYFVEVFILKNLNQIQWIEVQRNPSILQEYTQNVNLNNLFN